jgi:hypothetical protein
MLQSMVKVSQPTACPVEVLDATPILPLIPVKGGKRMVRKIIRCRRLLPCGKRRAVGRSTW